LATCTFTELEAIIANGEAAFIQTGRALFRIRDEQLYTDGYETFEDYCAIRWGWTRSRAYQLIRAVQVADQIKDATGEVPATERVARALLQVPDNLRPDVWAKAKSQAGDAAITVEHIVAVKPKKRKRTRKAKTTPSQIDTDAFGDMEEWNRQLAAVEVQLEKLESLPDGPWLDETTLGIIRDQAAVAAWTIRKWEGFAICPSCSGKCCEKCRQTGFMPEAQYDLAIATIDK